MKKKQNKQEDERNLLEQSFETQKNDMDTIISLGKRITSPRDIRQIDSVSFAKLGDDTDDIYRASLAIAAVGASFSLDEFTDEEQQDVSTEYSGAQFVPGEDSQQSYVQFVPGANAIMDSSSPGKNMSQQLLQEINAVAETELVLKEEGVEAQVQDRLLQGMNEIAAPVHKELMQRTVLPADVRHENDDVALISNADGRRGDDTFIQKRRKLCFGVIVSLLLIAVGLATALGFMLSRDEQGSGNARAANKCSLCADGTIPTNFGENSVTQSQTCSDFLESQAVLDATDSRCQQGQALAWMYCGCPTPPLVSKADKSPSCTFCPDGTMPIGQGCADFNAAVAIVGTSPFVSCEEAIEMVPGDCSCPNLDRVEQFRRLLQPISGEALEDSSSPQFQALKWIAHADPAKLSVGQDSSQVIQQRYVAAVLYFALGGETWTDQYNFLSANKTCEWLVNKDGIQCDDRDEVISIHLRKC